jgi:hypothetical protein
MTISFLEFNIDRVVKRKSTKTNNELMQNNDSMMNINPFVPSEINSKMSNYNLKSHSSFSKEGHEIVFTMKESLRDLDSFNLSPEKTTPIIMH